MKLNHKAKTGDDVIVRRPVESWQQGLAETGVVLTTDGEGDGRVLMYGILEGGVAALIEPAPEGGWRLSEVPDREKVVISARYPDRKLRFASDPVGTIWRNRPGLPLQEVNPKKINLVFTGDIEPLLRRRGQALSGSWDQQVASEPFVETKAYRAMQEAGDSDPIFRAIRSEGYRTQDSPNAVEEVQVGIARNGRYILLSGAKRVAAARLLGLKTIPVNVAVRHADWEDLREKVIAFAGRHEGRVYQRIEHPDLFDIQAHHYDDRLPIISKAFEGYDPAGKKLLDVGPHWGQMSRAMEELGFDVTGAEANPASAKMAMRLRDATEHKYRIWEGSVFDFPEIGEMNVILGLNIFHHFLKRQETHDALVDMLARTRADMIIFAAHVWDRRGPDFKDAYRNYKPDEFARFVSEHSRLPDIELLGHSHDGRPLFKIYRRKVW